ncbi:MAG: chromosomal replication initiator protein DnaA [Bacilli bacterium]|nr:chromosomal replication initiator protein DnaA [Bacilli bacterium]MDD4077320.1 chromosomal replication initiator protein DnaA [Bacilli bacterium]MDD4387825.1 chromosomal replication initiator protein DnaA [Bacilli bacterium]
MKQGLKLWEQTLNALKQDLDEADFSVLFSEANKIYKVENNFIYIIVPNALTKFRIEKFYINRLNEIASSLSDSLVKFKFILKDDIDELEKLMPTEKEDVNKRPLRAEYTFNNFVTGESNRFAFLSAMKVAETPESLYNPLYIFGDVGLGKTHLMMAIGNYILDNKPETNVVYTSAQEFTEDYFLATSTRKGKENIEQFYRKYRDSDVLLVDDIQFLENKHSTQEEFFKVFEHLHGINKQIVITSDRSANELKNMMSRLKSRFNWGLSVDIKVPDKPLRLNILKRKLGFLIENPKDVPLDVLEIIADYFTNNIRDLEGALRRYVTYCVSLNIPFTVENLYIALERLIPEDEEEKNISSKLFENVKREVAAYYKVAVSDLESPSRKQVFTYARQMAIYIIKAHYNPSLKLIGEFFGNRDHATISHSFDKIKNLLKTNPLVKNDYDILIKKINK